MSRRSHWSHLVAAGASAVALLGLWLPWYGFSLAGISGALSQAKSLGPFGLLTVAIARKLAAIHFDAWQAMHGWTAIFAAGMVLAGGVAVVHATGRDLHRRLGWMAVAGALAAVLFAAYEIVDPSANAGAALIHVRFGAFVSLLAAGVALGAWVFTQLGTADAARPVNQPPAAAPAGLIASPASSPSIASPASSTSIAPPGW